MSEGAKETLARPHPARIAIISATVLVLELAFIRLIPSEVRILGYFTNLLLMASFFGLGLGCMLEEQRARSVLFPGGLLLVAGLAYAARGVVIYEGAQAVHFWLDQNSDMPDRAPAIPLFPAAVIAFVACATPFVTLGQRLATEMSRHERLRAYGWDIAGSLGGTIVFAIASRAGVPPWVWPPLLALAWAIFFVEGKAARLAHVACGLAFVAFAHSARPAQWSPYYLVQHTKGAQGLEVLVNSSFHQFAVDFESPANKEMAESLGAKFGIPYAVYRELHQGKGPEKVLVLGAGTGNDINVALRNGARSVVAVEIDPVILSLGELNASQPYKDARVRAVVDDARHYLRTSDETFDLIVFGTLDSQTLLSGHTNLRLENYVYTSESFADARARLAPGGIMAAYYSVLKPWLYARIVATIRSAFGDRLRVLLLDPRLFNTIVLASVDVDVRGDPAELLKIGEDRPSTDDWPFLYLERPTVATVYIQLFAAILGLIALVVLLLKKMHPGEALPRSLFFLGLGFTLMESAAVVRLALLFGNTWTVNAVVFASVLATIAIANALVVARRAPPIGIAWIGLGATIAVAGLFPLPWLVALPEAGRVAASAVLVGLPVFFAAVCFSRLFDREKRTGTALGANLIGAMAGGTLEYVSMALGMRAVWGVVFVVYALALAFSLTRTPPSGRESRL